MAEKKQSTQKKVLWLTETAIFAAIIVVMSFTPLGYLKTAGLEITFNMIPVVIGAIVGGPSAGAILGGVFGLTSFIQCFGSSPFGATLLGINPILTCIVCMTRILAGWLAGVAYKGIARKEKRQIIGSTVAALVGPISNTVFFTGSLVLFFGRTEFIQNLMSQMGTSSVFSFIVAFVGLQGLVEAIVCFVVTDAVSNVLLKVVNKRIR